DIGAGMPLGAALTNDDVARNDGFAAELLHAEALGFRIATVARRTASFLMCHCCSPSAQAYSFSAEAAAFFGAAFFAGFSAVSALAAASAFAGFAPPVRISAI